MWVASERAPQGRAFPPGHPYGSRAAGERFSPGHRTSTGRPGAISLQSPNVTDEPAQRWETRSGSVRLPSYPVDASRGATDVDQLMMPLFALKRIPAWVYPRKLLLIAGRPPGGSGRWHPHVFQTLVCRLTAGLKPYCARNALVKTISQIIFSPVLPPWQCQGNVPLTASCHESDATNLRSHSRERIGSPDGRPQSEAAHRNPGCMSHRWDTMA